MLYIFQKKHKKDKDNKEKHQKSKKKKKKSSSKDKNKDTKKSDSEQNPKPGSSKTLEQKDITVEETPLKREFYEEFDESALSSQESVKTTDILYSDSDCSPQKAQAKKLKLNKSDTGVDKPSLVGSSSPDKKVVDKNSKDRDESIKGNSDLGSKDLVSNNNACPKGESKVSVNTSNSSEIFGLVLEIPSQSSLGNCSSNDIDIGGEVSNSVGISESKTSVMDESREVDSDTDDRLLNSDGEEMEEIEVEEEIEIEVEVEVDDSEEEEDDINLNATNEPSELETSNSDSKPDIAVTADQSLEDLSSMDTGDEILPTDSISQNVIQFKSFAIKTIPKDQSPQKEVKHIPQAVTSKETDESNSVLEKETVIENTNSSTVCSDQEMVSDNESTSGSVGTDESELESGELSTSSESEESPSLNGSLHQSNQSYQEYDTAQEHHFNPEQDYHQYYPDQVMEEGRKLTPIRLFPFKIVVLY